MGLKGWVGESRGWCKGRKQEEKKNKKKQADLQRDGDFSEVDVQLHIAIFSWNPFLTFHRTIFFFFFSKDNIVACSRPAQAIFTLFSLPCRGGNARAGGSFYLFFVSTRVGHSRRHTRVQTLPLGKLSRQRAT